LETWLSLAIWFIWVERHKIKSFYHKIKKEVIRDYLDEMSQSLKIIFDTPLLAKLPNSAKSNPAVNIFPSAHINTTRT
jgi:hypothetical protein